MSNYNTATTTANVTVNKATPNIHTPPTASSIIYGQTLAASTLTGGAASEPGTFTFTTPGTVPNAGTAAQDVTFTPTDTANYNTASTTVNVTVSTLTVTASAGPNGSISPTGAVVVQYGSNQTFTITPSAFYVVDDVLVDLASIGASNSYTFLGVTNNHSISATFAVEMTTNSIPTPTEWLNYYYGVTNYNEAAASDTDGDKLSAAQEYLAGTDPTNTASVFKVIQIRRAGATNFVVWLGGNTNLTPFGVYVTTNLMDVSGGWGLAATVPRSESGTNYLDHDVSSATNVPRYYKIVATNTP